METGDLKIDITTKTYSQTQTSSLPLSLNIVCINLCQQFERFWIDKSDGSVTFTGFYPAHPLHISQILLNLFNYEFNTFHLFPLLNSRLHDPSLSEYIAEVIAARASLSVGLLQPLFMSVNVVFTQEVFSVIPVSCLPKEETQEEEDESTCSICLEEVFNDDEDDKRIIKLPDCSHRFHKVCIFEWLMRCNSCPLCRRIVLEESQYSCMMESEI
ncbi:Zinc finger RING-type [Arabidopsis suecica]|uniref:Zinc finger RING-type n=1 Tax=Arabidopsis suecica TaxID=45249 RepID=A0A8T2AFD5_ARASU|nr:Zinc finger RING-type [Arabidopsis suecica]